MEKLPVYAEISVKVERISGAVVTDLASHAHLSHDSLRSDALWLTTGMLSGGAAAFRPQATSRTRRQLLAARAASGLSLTLDGSGQGGFNWRGGAPDTLVDLGNYPDGVWASGHVYSPTNNSLTVSTHRLTDNPAVAAGQAVVYVEGEAEADYGVWPGSASDA